MLSGSEASAVSMLAAGGPGCFAATQHGMGERPFFQLVRKACLFKFKPEPAPI